MIGRDFLSAYGGLQKDVQKKVMKVLEMFEDHTGAGINLEKPVGIADDRGRTIRIDRFWRGVVAAAGGPDDKHVLLDVLPHDDAYAWLQRHTFDVNPATGAFQVTDIEAVKSFNRRAEPSDEEPGPLLADVPDKHFRQLGIPDAVVSLVRPLTTEEEILALADLLPESQGHALLGLAAGQSPDVIYGELVADADPGEIDETDLAAASERPASSALLYVVRDVGDLHEVLNEPFEQWRHFLHPSQRQLAYRSSFNGPVKITGGAGTGKTVVAMHRAKHLAKRAEEGDGILLTTFTRNLASNLHAAFEGLAGPLTDRVAVRNVDAVAYQILRRAEGRPPAIVSRPAEIWAAAASAVRADHLAPEILDDEYENVVLGNDIRDRDAYFRVERAGQGVPLDRRRRAEVWRVVEEFERRTAQAGRWTFLQIAREAMDWLRANGPIYRHIVVDEAQDLHPLQWRMLRAAAPESRDDLFLVGDTHQRIYDRRVSLRSLGIHVVGRSYRLRLNYRTTEEILRWSLGLLGEQPFDDLDGGRDSMAGYRSPLHGPPPVEERFSTRADELIALGEAIQAWLDEGVPAEEIGVAARTNRLIDDVRGALQDLGLKVADLDDTRTEGAVRIGTMHRMKGLEFRCVSVAGVDSGLVPLAAAVCDHEIDPARHERDVQRERCLLYVACTRARDRLRVSWASARSPVLPP